MDRTYILVAYGVNEVIDKILGAWQRKNSLLYYAKNNEITQQDAYVIVVIDNFYAPVKFDVHNWEDKKVWKNNA